MKRVTRSRLDDAFGFSLIELLVVASVLAIVAGIAMPGIVNQLDGIKLGMSTRAVQSELQTARLKAVSANTYMRLMFDCPVAGQFRMVERIGPPYAAETGDDLAANAARRCDPTTYPAKLSGPDTNRVTKPNNDGAVRYLQTSVSFSQKQTVEFWPDGSAHISGATPWPVVPAAGVTIQLSKGTATKTITVTSAGNIQMQR